MSVINGGILDDSLVGSTGADSISGFAGNDTLDGGPGNDTLVGGTGNDTYLVDSALDVLVESANEGTDTVITSVALALGANFENLVTAAGANDGSVLTARSQDGTFAAQRVVSATNPIVGAWYQEDSVGLVVFTFAADGTYMEAEDGVTDPSGHSGMERGTYTWNAGTGAFTRVTTVDTNGEWGLSHATVTSVQVNGDTLSMTVAGEGTFTFNRVTSTTNAIVGGWFASDGGSQGGAVALTFLPNGEYMLAEDTDGTDPTTQDGMERGTYTWNSGTGAFSSITTVNTDGQGGLSDDAVPPNILVGGVAGTGNALANVMTGNSGDNLLIGLGGNDSLYGLAGADLLASGDGNDYVSGGDGNDNLEGGSGVDTLDGGLGNDQLDGGGTAGGSGVDIADYSTAPGGVTVNLVTGIVTGAAGQDGLLRIEGVLGSAFGDNITGDATANLLNGNAGNDTIFAGAGNDTIYGGPGQDNLFGSPGDDVMDGGAVLDRVNYTDLNIMSYTPATSAVDVNLVTGVASDGQGGHDTLVNINFVNGSSFNDRLTGTSGSIFEIFEGGPGDDIIDGGAIDGVTGLGSNRANYTTIATSINVNLATGLATGGGGNDTLININMVRATNAADVLTGSNTTTYIEYFEGRGGNDTIDGQGGIDGVRYDTATGPAIVNLVTGTAQDGQGGTDTLYNIEGIRGGNFDDVLTGGNPANGTGSSDGLEFFLGGAGNDTLDGGGGYDRADYSSSTSGITVTLGGIGNGTAIDGLGGIDTLISIEGVRGSEFNDVLNGSDTGIFESFEGRTGNDTIDGRGGIDRVDYAASVGAVVVSLASGTTQDGYGTADQISHIEMVRGSSFGDIITGDAGDNTLEGGAGNDTIDGGAGNDTAVFSGNFAAYTITVESGNNDILVSGPDGTDRLRNIEVLQFADRNFKVEQGTPVADTLVGTADAELFVGREGNDTISGAGGNDALYGDEGTDTLNGGTGNDFLDGGTGNDVMTGGTGDDTYVVDSEQDSVIEEAGPQALLKDPLPDNAGAGVDTVIASINYTLGSFLENLTLSGSANLRGTGNALANVITGNVGNNVLTGDAGNDAIDGGDGVDTASYAGLRGAYTLGTQGDARTISSSSEGTDTLTHVERAVFANGEHVAIDLQAAAGLTARLVGAFFGPAAVANGALVGQYLAMFDAGLGYEEVAAAALASPQFAQAAGSHANLAFVNFVYQNVAGFAPDAATRDMLVTLLANGYFTQASMGVLAADHPNTLVRIGFDGLSANGMGYTESTASVSSGGAGNDILTGTAAADVMVGRDGNDVMTGLAGNDMIMGGAGVDRAAYSTARSASAITHNDLGLIVTTGAESDQLMQVERVSFSDIAVAYDTDGNAGTVAKIIGAMFGTAALQDEALVGQYLAMLDAGTSYEDTVGAAAASARFGTEAGSHSNEAFVDRVYFNIAHILPDPATHAQLEGYLALPGFTQAHLGMLAAEVDYNVANVNLTGLAQTGLEYLSS